MESRKGGVMKPIWKLEFGVWKGTVARGEGWRRGEEGERRELRTRMPMSRREARRGRSLDDWVGAGHAQGCVEGGGKKRDVRGCRGRGREGCGEMRRAGESGEEESALECNDNVALARHRIRLFAVGSEVLVPPQDLRLTRPLAKRRRRHRRVHLGSLSGGDDAAHWASWLWCETHRRQMLLSSSSSSSPSWRECVPGV